MNVGLHRSLPLAMWPAPDRTAWQELASAKAGLLDSTKAHQLSPVTIQDLQRRYGCFLNFAREQGCLQETPEAASVTESVVRAYIEWLAPRVASVTLAGSIRKILRVAELLNAERDWGWLRHYANRLEYHMRPRNKRPDVVDVRLLYRLGIDLMERAKQDALSPGRKACLYRDGLLIAMLAASALRLGAFMRLEIGKTFSFSGTFWTIHLPGTRGTKYKRPVEKPLPTDLSPFIDRWINVHRLHFRGARQHRRLWPSQKGILTAGQAHRIIAARTNETFGHRINPHLFRDCAVTTICTEFSAEAHLGSSVLDHIDPKTTAKHYNQAKMADAVKAYQRRMELRD
jgi:integrase